jgi:hypothetical protein
MASKRCHPVLCRPRSTWWCPPRWMRMAASRWMRTRTWLRCSSGCRRSGVRARRSRPGGHRRPCQTGAGRGASRPPAVSWTAIAHGSSMGPNRLTHAATASPSASRTSPITVPVGLGRESMEGSRCRVATAVSARSASALVRARRSQPRTVVAGRSTSSAARRYPRPSAAASRASRPSGPCQGAAGTCTPRIRRGSPGRTGIAPVGAGTSASRRRDQPAGGRGPTAPAGHRSQGSRVDLRAAGRWCVGVVGQQHEWSSKPGCPGTAGRATSCCTLPDAMQSRQHGPDRARPRRRQHEHAPVLTLPVANRPADPP